MGLHIKKSVRRIFRPRGFAKKIDLYKQLRLGVRRLRDKLGLGRLAGSSSVTSASGVAASPYGATGSIVGRY